MLANAKDKSMRNSGIELLKIIAIMLIVLSHVTQTLGSENLRVGFSDYVIKLGISSDNIQTVILMLFYQTGLLGNNIFFACSAWFLVDSKKSNRKKAFDLLCTVWVISIIYLVIYLLAAPQLLSTKDIIKELLPTCFSNNWYMTAYIIFLFMFPLYNKLISIVDQKQHLRIVLFSSLLWIVIDYFKGDFFFPSMVLVWGSVYFLIAYLKKYCKWIVENIKVGYALLIIGVVGYIAQVVITNYVGLYLIGAFSQKVLRWNTNCCPFYIMIALGSVIISSHAKFKSRFINYVSGLTMFIYLIHENLLFRTFTRPYIWQQIYLNVGYEHVALLDLLYAFILFLAATLLSALYRESIQKIVTKISAKLYIVISSSYKRLEARLIGNKE